MIKKCLYSISCMLIILLLSSQLDQTHYKGNIRKLTQTTYAVNEYFGELKQEGPIEIRIEEYDVHGNLIREYIEEHYAIKGSEDSTLSKKYDNYRDTKYYYDDKGRLIKRDWFSSGAIVERRIYRYDEKGNLAETTIYGYNGAIAYKTIAQYDESNKIISEMYYDRNGLKTNYSIYEYKEDGDSAERYFNINGELLWITLTKYNHRGDVILEEQTRANGELIRKYEYEYGTFGQVVLERIDDVTTSIGNGEYKYEYDSIGNLIKKTYFDSSDKSQRISLYENDEKGNWILRKEGTQAYRFDKIELIVDRLATRSIEYW